MATDDDTGWTAILLDSWGPLVRDAVVAKVEAATVGHRGPLVRTLHAPDDARYVHEQQLHELVLLAIRAETGADLEELGSQAAWACYDDVWMALADRWADGGSLAYVPDHEAVRAARLLAKLSSAGAEAAAADIAHVPARFLELDGRARVDVEGLWAHVAGNDVDRRERAVVEELVTLAQRRATG